jgi:hypothetical protein
MDIAFFSVLLSPRDPQRHCGQQVELDRRLLLLPKYLSVGFAVWIKVLMFTAFPSGFHFGPTNIPIRAEFVEHGAQVLPKLFDGRSAKKPVVVVDFEYNETRFQDDDVGIIGLCSGSVYSAMSRSF